MDGKATGRRRALHYSAAMTCRQRRRRVAQKSVAVSRMEVQKPESAQEASGENSPANHRPVADRASVAMARVMTAVVRGMARRFVMRK